MKTINSIFKATVEKSSIFILLFLSLVIYSCKSDVKKEEAGGHDAQEFPEIQGRWDLTVDKGENSGEDRRVVPSWLEVKHSGLRTLVGYFVGEGGSARPISHVIYNDGKISFKIPAQWEKSEQDMVFEGTLADGKLSGSIVTPIGKKLTFTGVKAPSLARDAEPVWGEPIKLFNGVSTEGWHGSKDSMQWIVVDSVLTSPKSGVNIISGSFIAFTITQLGSSLGFWDISPSSNLALTSILGVVSIVRYYCWRRVFNKKLQGNENESSVRV